MWWLLALLVAPARADVPLPSYRDAASRSVWLEVNSLLERGDPEEAIEAAKEFQRVVMQTAGLEYLIGLSYRLLDQPDEAEEHLLRSIRLDPGYPSPYNDLGELYLVQGRFDEARGAFLKVQELVPSGPGSSLAPRRLAEIAAHQQDPEAFERHVRDALERGFSFRDIAGLPNWQKYYADPVMHDSIVKMITVYGDRKVLETLAPAASASPPEPP